MLPTRPLGRTDLTVTRLGYGSMGLRGPRTWGRRVVSEGDSERLLNAVLDAGINFIDTSPDYGIAEERIGRAISHRRDQFFLATKCGCTPIQRDDHLEIDHTWTRETIRRNLEQSLTRLRTDHLDLLQFHGGDPETLRREGLIDQLEEFKNAGQVRFLGVSSSPPHLSGMIDLGVFDVIQLPFSCLEPDLHDDMIRAASTGAGVVVRGGIGKGGPDAEIQRPELNSVWERAGLDELRDSNESRASFILRYTLSHPSCDTTIVGTCNPAHLTENIAAVECGPLAIDVCEQVRHRVARVLETDRDA